MGLDTRRSRRLLVGLIVTAAAVASAPASAGAIPAGPLGHEGRWITDAQGRVVVLHGFNMVAKTAPFYPAALGFGADDARFLRRNGFNTVRLGVIYEAVEPAPGHYDDRYLDEIAREVRLLARHRLFVLLDFHQDQYNRAFQGNGFPDWAVLDDGLAREPRRGFPFNYYSMPALQRAYDSFWSNRAGPGGVGLQDRYAAAWGHVAERLGGLPGVLGYDIMNEPWPGSRLDCSSWAGCPDFDRGPLADFNRRVFRAIRQADRRHLIWHEPLLPYGFGADTSTPDTGDARAGFSFHMYCIGIPGFAGGESRPCAQVNPTYFAHADAVSARGGDALLLTEFGANIRTPDSIVEATALADSYMVGWQEWQYDDPFSNAPGEALVLDPLQPPAGANVDQGKLDLLARPYPQAIAGTPVRWSFDPATRRFQLVYRVDRAGGGRPAPNARTEVALPRLKYPDGYRATVEGGRIISRPNAPVLKIVARRGARSVMVDVTP